MVAWILRSEVLDGQDPALGQHSLQLDGRTRVEGQQTSAFEDPDQAG